MKRLSDFKNEKGIEIASKVLSVIFTMMENQRNMSVSKEKNPVKMFTTFMANSPKEMKKIFAILSEKEEGEYRCDGAEAMTNMLLLANDPIIVGLFISQGQTGVAKSSASVSENTEE